MLQGISKYRTEANLEGLEHFAKMYGYYNESTQRILHLKVNANTCNHKLSFRDPKEIIYKLTAENYILTEALYAIKEKGSYSVKNICERGINKILDRTDRLKHRQCWRIENDTIAQVKQDAGTQTDHEQTNGTISSPKICLSTDISLENSNKKKVNIANNTVSEENQCSSTNGPGEADDSSKFGNALLIKFPSNSSMEDNISCLDLENSEYQ